MKILLEDARAESVQRADLCPLDQGKLAYEPRIILLLQAIPQHAFDAVAHLIGGGVGEGDDEQLIDAAFVRRFADQIRASLGEHRGLPRAGGGADQQAVPGRLDRPVLLLRPFRGRCPMAIAGDAGDTAGLRCASSSPPSCASLSSTPSRPSTVRWLYRFVSVSNRQTERYSQFGHGVSWPIRYGIDIDPPGDDLSPSSRQTFLNMCEAARQIHPPRLRRNYCGNPARRLS